MKICTKCKYLKSKTSFFKDLSKKDGLTCWCKECCIQCRQSNEDHYKQYYVEV